MFSQLIAIVLVGVFSVLLALKALFGFFSSDTTLVAALLLVASCLQIVMLGMAYTACRSLLHKEEHLKDTRAALVWAVVLMLVGVNVLAIYFPEEQAVLSVARLYNIMAELSVVVLLLPSALERLRRIKDPKLLEHIYSVVFVCMGVGTMGVSLLHSIALLQLAAEGDGWARAAHTVACVALLAGGALAIFEASERRFFRDEVNQGAYQVWFGMTFMGALGAAFIPELPGAPDLSTGFYLRLSLCDWALVAAVLCTLAMSWILRYVENEKAIADAYAMYHRPR